MEIVKDEPRDTKKIVRMAITSWSSKRSNFHYEKDQKYYSLSTCQPLKPMDQHTWSNNTLVSPKTYLFDISPKTITKLFPMRLQPKPKPSSPLRQEASPKGVGTSLSRPPNLSILGMRLGFRIQNMDTWRLFITSEWKHALNAQHDTKSRTTRSLSLKIKTLVNLTPSFSTILRTSLQDP